MSPSVWTIVCRASPSADSSSLSRNRYEKLRSSRLNWRLSFIVKLPEEIIHRRDAETAEKKRKGPGIGSLMGLLLGGLGVSAVNNFLLEPHRFHDAAGDGVGVLLYHELRKDFFQVGQAHQIA